MDIHHRHAPNPRSQQWFQWLQDALNILLVSIELTKKLPRLSSRISYGTIDSVLHEMTALLNSWTGITKQTFQQVLASFTYFHQS